MTGQLGRLAAEGGVIVSHAAPRAHWFARIVRAAMTLTVPALAVVATLAFAWAMRSTPLTLLDGILSPADRPELQPSTWLSVGHAIVPVIFFVANLVNRRYGENYAIAHILASWACATLLVLAMMYHIDPGLPSPGEVPGPRIAGAFLGSMVIGQLLGAFVFDRTRGVVWWNAPLYSALYSSFGATFLFYVAAYAGTEWIWINHMAIDAGVKAAMSFALLLPYLALRPIVRPLAGFGGF